MKKQRHLFATKSEQIIVRLSTGVSIGLFVLLLCASGVVARSDITRTRPEPPMLTHALPHELLAAPRRRNNNSAIRFSQSISDVQVTRILLPLISIPPVVTPFGVEAWPSSLKRTEIFSPTSNIGATWVRLNEVSWRDIQPERDGAYNWDVLADFEQDVQRLTAANMIPMVVVDDYPDWATTYNSPCSPLKSEALPAFATFLQTLVTRYHTPPYHVHYWELGNEPDVDWHIAPNPDLFGCWGNMDDTEFYGGEQYGNMIRAVAPAIRQADPNAMIVLGGLLLDSPGSSTDTGVPERFFRGVLAANSAPYFDMVAIHAYARYYGGSKPDYDELDTKWINWGGVTIGKLRFIQQILAEYGVNKPITINESGMVYKDDTDPPASFYEAQANQAVRQPVRARATGVHSLIWYTINGPGWRNSGLLDGSQLPKAAYTAYHYVIHQMGNAIPMALDTTIYGTNVEAYRITRSNDILDILWSKDAEAYYVDVPSSEFLHASARDGSPLATINTGERKMVQVGPSPIYIVRQK